MNSFSTMRSFSKDSLDGQTVRRDTWRRVLRYARPHRGRIGVLVLLVLASSLLVVAGPLILKAVVDEGVLRGDRTLVLVLAGAAAVAAILELILTIVQRRFTARIGEGLIYDLRTEVFGHVLRQPVAFFTRSQTGALVSRINHDVIGAQQAFSSLLASLLTNALTLILTLGTMLALSWQLTLGALLLVPLFVLPARLMGRRLATLTRESMTLNADLGTRMTERFNVAGALLVKLFGSQEREEREYAERAGRVADIGVAIAINRTVFVATLTAVAALATALVYGLGGLMAADGRLTVGALLAMTALLARLYAPLTALSNARVEILTAMVSFERIFEVLDLRPLVQESAHPRVLPPGPLPIRLERVSFSYPSADEVSLRSLESGASGDRGASAPVLHDVSIDVPAGGLVALVGPSGAGKTTITSLIARLYDPTQGRVIVDGVDAREIGSASLRSSIGMVTQEAHLFHATLAENLRYAKPDADDDEIWAALEAAQIRPLVASLPQGLDTVVGDRGHRLSGGEKQRIAIARLLLKSPGVVILDEATAHLDSESERAVHAALDGALAGRTAVVIAHRLSTVRSADRIVVVDGGRVVEQGTHAELSALGGLYADLSRTQFDDGAPGTATG